MSDTSEQVYRCKLETVGTVIYDARDSLRNAGLPYDENALVVTAGGIPEY